MAKDPAFLFYPGDYIAGTMHLDFECKGAYMDLLMLQFQKDHMTLHMIKHVLGHKFEHIWPQISDKFSEDNGRFWNERLKKEKEKRISYCKSRKENRNKVDHKTKHMTLHMSQHMENENENIIIEEVIKQLEKLNNIKVALNEKKYYMFLVVEMAKIFTDENPEYFFNKEMDYSACLQIAYNIAHMKKWSKVEVLNGKMNEALDSWKIIVPFIKADKWLRTRSLTDISSITEWQRLVQKMKNQDKNAKGLPDAVGKEFIPD